MADYNARQDWYAAQETMAAHDQSILSPSEFASCVEALLSPGADRSAEIETRNAELETRTAAKNWEFFYRLRPGTACLGRIRGSSAGISGWASCNFKR